MLNVSVRFHPYFREVTKVWVETDTYGRHNTGSRRRRLPLRLRLGLCLKAKIGGHLGDVRGALPGSLQNGRELDYPGPLFR